MAVAASTTLGQSGSRVGSGLTGPIQAFWVWWTRELARMVPRWMALRAPERVRAVVLCLDARITLSDETRSRPTVIGSADAGDLAAERGLVASARRLAERSRCPLVVRLPAGSALVRTLTLPRVADEAIGGLLALDLERATPFKAADVSFGWCCSPDPELPDKIAVVQAVIKQTSLDAARERLAGLDLKPDRIEPSHPDRDLAGIDLCASRQPVARGASWRSRLRATLAVGCIGLGAALLWQLDYRQSQQLAALEDKLSADRALALALKADSDKASVELQSRSALWALRKKRPLAVELWNEVTHLLPDSAYLTTLRYDAHGINLAGHAKSAAGLIATLQSSRLLREPSLTSPVTFNAAAAIEQFEIGAKLAGSNDTVTP